MWYGCYCVSHFQYTFRVSFCLEGFYVSRVCDVDMTEPSPNSWCYFIIWFCRWSLYRLLVNVHFSPFMFDSLSARLGKLFSQHKNCFVSVNSLVFDVDLVRVRSLFVCFYTFFCYLWFGVFGTLFFACLILFFCFFLLLLFYNIKKSLLSSWNGEKFRLYLWNVNELKLYLYNEMWVTFYFSVAKFEYPRKKQREKLHK